MIAVVPARGGSKGIKRKNLRFLNGKPLLFYVLQTLKTCKLIDDIVVTTDDNEIMHYVNQFGVKIHNRPPELAGDHVTLDPVVSSAVAWYEEVFEKKVDHVITVQPTSPLLTNKTLSEAIRYFTASDSDCVISAVDDTHLTWKIEQDRYIPNYKKRLNRQWLDKVLKETGAFVISKRHILDSGSRIGGEIKLFEMPAIEGIDIDTPNDWLICSALLKRMAIDFVVIGSNEVGMGHIRRSLTLANYWLGHDIRFIGLNLDDTVIELLKNQNFEVYNAGSYEEALKWIRDDSLVINDILDTTQQYIAQIKKKNTFVVNFEDLGDGTECADLVINALYEKANCPENHKYGYEYECLDERFLMVPSNEFREQCSRILVSFGGADPSNYTLKAIKALNRMQISYDVKVVLGPAYRQLTELTQYLNETVSIHNIKVLTSVTNMAELMEGIDLAITSNGRTIFELAAMGIPLISMAQNERETLHLFARYSKGVRYLGMGQKITPEELAAEIENIIHNPLNRRNMYNSIPSDSIRDGLSRVTGLIESNYWRWKRENDKHREEND